jgi:hypothetical protein
MDKLCHPRHMRFIVEHFPSLKSLDLLLYSTAAGTNFKCEYLIEFENILVYKSEVWSASFMEKPEVESCATVPLN